MGQRPGMKGRLPRWAILPAAFICLLVVSLAVEVISFVTGGSQLRGLAFFGPHIVSLPIFILAFVASRVAARHAPLHVLVIVVGSITTSAVFSVVYYALSLSLFDLYVRGR